MITYTSNNNVLNQAKDITSSKLSPEKQTSLSNSSERSENTPSLNASSVHGKNLIVKCNLVS